MIIITSFSLEKDAHAIVELRTAKVDFTEPLIKFMPLRF